MTAESLAFVAWQEQAARDALEHAIRTAHTEGMGVREIARATGRHHTWVRRRLTAGITKAPDH